MAYFPTASVETGFAAALNIGSAPGASFGGSPGCRPDFSRSSLHMAHGHASRRNVNEYVERCPSFQSISMPVPVVRFTRTDAGSLASEGRMFTAGMLSVSHSGNGWMPSPRGPVKHRRDLEYRAQIRYNQLFPPQVLNFFGVLEWLKCVLYAARSRSSEITSVMLTT